MIIDYSAVVSMITREVLNKAAQSVSCIVQFHLILCLYICNCQAGPRESVSFNAALKLSPASVTVKHSEKTLSPQFLLFGHFLHPKSSNEISTPHFTVHINLVGIFWPAGNRNTGLHLIALFQSIEPNTSKVARSCPWLINSPFVPKTPVIIRQYTQLNHPGVHYILSIPVTKHRQPELIQVHD